MCLPLCWRLPQGHSCRPARWQIWGICHSFPFLNHQKIPTLDGQDRSRIYKSFWQIRIFFMILLRRKLPVLTGLDLWSMVMKMFRIENISIVKCCILDNFAWSEISATFSWLNREVTWTKKNGQKIELEVWMRSFSVWEPTYFFVGIFWISTSFL